jgi:hypothetical protein
MLPLPLLTVVTTRDVLPISTVYAPLWGQLAQMPPSVAGRRHLM